MNLLLELYPGNQIVVVMITTLVLISSAIMVAFVWAQIAAQKNAAMRSSIWIAALACALLGPVLVYAAVNADVHVVAFSLPDVRTSPAQLPSSDLTMPAATLPRPKMAPEISRKPSGLQKTVLVQSPQTSKPAVSELRYTANDVISRIEIWRGIWTVLVGVWGVGIVVCVARLAVGIGRLIRLRSKVLPLGEDRADHILQEVCRQIGIKKLPRLVVSSEVSYPIAAGGVGDPLIILPKGLPARLDGHQLRDILTHECAHVVGRDFLLGFAQRLAQILYWPYPPIYYLNDQLTRAREDVCDNYVLYHGDAPGYAQALLTLARDVRILPTSVGTLGFLRTGWQLEARISRLLDQKRNLMTRISYTAGAGVLVVFVTLALAIAGTRILQAEVEITEAFSGPAEPTQKAEIQSGETADSSSPAQEGQSGGTAWIEKLGGTYEVDQQSPDRPVVRVNLSNTPVTDDNLAELAALAELRVLNLTNTRIGDSGVKHLKSLQNIRELILDDTLVGNDGLEALAPLISLQRLGLGGTKVGNTGLEHLRNLPQLRHLDLRETSIDDTGMASLSDFKLRVLRLNYSRKITSSGFVHLQTLTELQTLGLYGTEISDSDLAHLRGLTKLNELSLGYTDITDDGLTHLAALTNLRKLELPWAGRQRDDRRISDAGLAHLQGLTNLEDLNLWDSRVSDAGLRYLKGMTNLNSLLLGRHHREDTDLTGEGLQHLKDLKKLKRLKLDGTDVTDHSLAHVAELELEYFSLHRCTQVTEAGLAHLKGMTSLTTLELPSANLTDSALEHLRNLTKLEALVLRGSNVTDAGLVHLAGLTNLRALYLSDQISGVGLRHLRACKSLEELYTGSGFTNDGMAHLEAFPHLKRLEIASSQFSDAGLAFVRGLTELEYLKFGERPAVTSAGLRHLKESISLTDLRISGTGIDDSGLAHVKGLKNLQTLRINHENPQISNSGVEHLKALPNLRDLRLNAVNVTDIGVTHLGELTGLNSLWTVNIAITDTNLGHLMSLGNLESLILQKSLVTGAGLKESLQGLGNLEYLMLRDCTITDNDIDQLRQLTGLAVINLRNTKVSEAGVAELRDGMPNTVIYYNP